MTQAAQKALARIRAAWDHTHDGRARIGALCSEIKAALAAEKEETMDESEALRGRAQVLLGELYAVLPPFLRAATEAEEERAVDAIMRALGDAPAKLAALEAKLDEPITAEEQELARAYVAARDSRTAAKVLMNAAGGLEASARAIGEFAKLDDGTHRTFTAREVREARRVAYEEAAATLRAAAHEAERGGL